MDKIITSMSSLESRVSRISTSSSEHAIKELKEDIQRIIGKIDSMDVRSCSFHYFITSALKLLNISNAFF